MLLLLLGHGSHHHRRRRRRFILIEVDEVVGGSREALCQCGCGGSLLLRLTYEKKVKSKSMQRKRKSGMNNKHDRRAALTLKEIAEIAWGGEGMSEYSYAEAGECGRRRWRVLARRLLHVRVRVRVRFRALLFLLFLFLRAPR